LTHLNTQKFSSSLAVNKDQYILCTETAADYFHEHNTRKHTLCGQNGDFLRVKGNSTYS